MNNPFSQDTLDIIDKHGLVITKDGLLRINNRCLISKRGVDIPQSKMFFPFDNISGSGTYKLEGGLWDKLNRFLPKSDCSCSVRVDLQNPRTMESGFEKYAALLYGVDFEQTLLDRACSPTALVHFDEFHGTGKPEKATMGIFPRDDGVVVLFLELLCSPDGDPPYTTTFIHSEYCKSMQMVSHADGALKMYSKDSYDKRYDANPTMAPHADTYNKVFRIDGGISFAEWLGLVSAFFHPHRLVKDLLSNPGKSIVPM